MKEKTIKIGFIGLGPRGRGLFETLFQIEEIKITAISDIVSENIDKTLEKFDEKGVVRPKTYTDHKALLANDEIDAVIIATNWLSHIPVAIDAMKAGKYTAIEVGPAASLDECWQLVRTSEETGMPCMLLENCCYGKYELMILNMIRMGRFGQVVHCECGYGHDLRYMVDEMHNRLRNNMHRNGDLYPTHGLGPIAKMLDINRGNRFVSLVSMASKASGLKDWIKKNKEEEHELSGFDFVKGDVVQTMIKCAHGQSILITHCVTLPRPYSRFNVIYGTNAIFSEEKMSIYLDEKKNEQWENVDDYYNVYAHPLWKEFDEEGSKGGHGGMDYLVLKAFAECVVNKTKPPIDVYDAASYMAVSVLSEESIYKGSGAVAFPDFTNGRWVDREAKPVSKYSL